MERRFAIDTLQKNPELRAELARVSRLGEWYEIPLAQLRLWDAKLNLRGGERLQQVISARLTLTLDPDKKKPRRFELWDVTTAGEESWVKDAGGLVEGHMLCDAEGEVYHVERATFLRVPRFWGLRFIGAPPPERVHLVDGLDISERSAFHGALCEGAEGAPPQRELCERVAEAIAEHGGAVLGAPTGIGKTVMAIHEVCRAGRKTLWVSTRRNLLQQSRERLGTFAPALTSDILTKAKYRRATAGWDVVFCTVQHLMKGTLPRELAEQFGLLVVDEVHQIATEQFVKMFHHVRPARVLSLSATLRRNDALFPVIPLHVGHLAASVTRTWGTIRVQFVLVKYAAQPAQQCPVPTHRWGVMKGRADFNGYLEFITEHEGRNRAICERIAEEADARGRHPYVTSFRVEHLRALQRARGGESGLLVGAVKGEAARAEALENRVIFTTLSLGSTGVDAPHIDTIISATPYSKSARVTTEQLVGRIRPKPGKKTPLIIDFVDNCPLGFAMRHPRREAYERLGCTFLDTRTVVV